MAANGKTERGNWIYIGPSIPPLGLQMNTIYRRPDLPAALKLIAASKPAVFALFVNTEDLAVAKQKLATPGSLEHAANQEMRAIAKNTPR